MAVNGAEWSGPLLAPFSLLRGKNLGTYLTEDQVGPRGSPDVLKKGKPSSLSRFDPSAIQLIGYLL